MSSNTITREQATERYGNVDVTFSHYYKYRFSFRGSFGGKELFVDVGGDRDNIYRFEVTDRPIKASELLRDWFGKVEVHESPDGKITIWDAD